MTVPPTSARAGPEESDMLRIIRHETLGIQSRQDCIALASPAFLILRIGRSGGRYDQRKVGEHLRCWFPRCLYGCRRLQRRTTVRFDAFGSAVVAAAVLPLEARRLCKIVGNGRKGILPQSRVDVLLPDPFGDGSLRARGAASLERQLLLRHEIRPGSEEQDPDEAVAAEVRELGVLCHRNTPSQQRVEALGFGFGFSGCCLRAAFSASKDFIWFWRPWAPVRHDRELVSN